jgi:uncharacterized membrane protein
LEKSTDHDEIRRQNRFHDRPAHGMASVAAFVMTGSFAASVAVALLEAVLMSLAHPLHDWAWKKAPALAKARSVRIDKTENVHFV